LLAVLLASASLACSQVATLTEPSPGDLLQKATANLKTARTAHIDGTGSFAIKAGMTIAFDFKVSGDTEVPDKSRLTTQMSLFGQAFTVDTITIDGRSYTRGLSGTTWQEGSPSDATQNAMLDPIGQTDLSGVTTVTEIDRPEVDGHKTRHLAYTVDANRLLEKMNAAPSPAPFKPSNVVGGGEVWIRTDDNQIVRQLVKVSFDMEGDLGLPTGAAPATPGKGSFEMTFDLRFTRVGDAITPAITAPPTH
jgi:hypothetical protein